MVEGAANLDGTVREETETQILSIHWLGPNAWMQRLVSSRLRSPSIHVVTLWNRRYLAGNKQNNSNDPLQRRRGEFFKLGVPHLTRGMTTEGRRRIKQLRTQNWRSSVAQMGTVTSRQILES